MLSRSALPLPCSGSGLLASKISRLIAHEIKARRLTPAGFLSEYLDEHPFMERLVFHLVSWRGLSQEDLMRLAIITLSAVAIVASAPVAFAQGVSSKTPGHEMQDKGSKKGSPGASGYAPGQEMQAKGSKKGSPGASGYAPGQTTGSSAGTRSK
jgi:hypothetical protein